VAASRTTQGETHYTLAQRSVAVKLAVRYTKLRCFLRAVFTNRRRKAPRVPLPNREWLALQSISRNFLFDLVQAASYNICL
jgi:hypothetical protein